MKTLVIHLGGIGDFILACPAIALLARDGPVALLGNRARLELAVAAGIADTAHDLAQVDFESIFSTPSARLISVIVMLPSGPSLPISSKHLRPYSS